MKICGKILRDIEKCFHYFKYIINIYSARQNRRDIGNKIKHT